MAINIATKAILKILSFGGIDVEVSRQLADLKRLDPMKIFYKKMDLQVYNGDYEVPIRVFFPDERLVMQFQADLLDTQVVRPSCIETTALGASYLAGLATGFWKDASEVKSNWQIGQQFTPRMTEEERKKKLKGWN